MSDAECYRCGTVIDPREDTWWQWNWEESPSSDDIDEAIQNPDFRDWFRENYLLCTGCHETVKAVFEGGEGDG